MTPRIFIAVFAICFAVAVSGQSLPATDPLEQLWGVAQIYFGDDKTASMTAQKDTGYISYNMGVMTLYKGSNVYTVNVMPDIFNQLWAISRIPMGAYYLLYVSASIVILISAVRSSRVLARTSTKED